MIKNIIIIMLIMLLVMGCASVPYVEVGAGKNTSFHNSMEWEDADDIALTGELGLEWEHSDLVRTKCRYLHVSQWFAGPPFNNEQESSLDHFGCSAQYKWAQ